MKYYLATILFATIFTVAPAQEARDVHDDNAALWYWRAFLTLEQYEDRPMEAINAVMMSEGVDAEGRRDVRMFTTLALPDLVRAAERSSCLFAVDWSAGIMATLPHISYLNQTFRLLEADAMGAIAADEHIVAAERIMLMLAMADHTSQEPVVLSCTMAARFVERCAALQRGMDLDDLDANTRAQLERSWSLVDHLVPEYLAETFRIHQQRTREGSWRQWAGEDGEERIREAFALIVHVESGQSPELGPIDTLDEQFDQWEALDEAVADAMRDRDDTMLSTISMKLRNGDFGWLAQGITSNFQRPYDEIVQAEATVRAMKQMLQQS